MPYGKLYAPDSLACHSRVLLAVLKAWLGFVAHRVGYQIKGVPLPSPEPEMPQAIGMSSHVVEYDAPTCHPWEGRFVTATSKLLKFAFAAELLMVIVFANAAVSNLVGYS